jgi:hypothetical protein
MKATEYGGRAAECLKNGFAVISKNRFVEKLPSVLAFPPRSETPALNRKTLNELYSSLS